MQITHEQAHTLIQLNMDQALGSQEMTVLFTHLEDCTDCQTYAQELKDMEGRLIPALKKQWSRQPTPLSITVLKERIQKTQASTLLTMRTAAMSLVVLAMFFSVWQFVFFGPSTSDQSPQLVPPVPTPSTISTNTMVTLENCELALYVVQANDTLAGIATQFLVATDEIMQINQLKTEAIQPSMKLIIPICKSTPTGTVHPVTFTTTYTPIINPTTSTPDG